MGTFNNRTYTYSVLKIQCKMLKAIADRKKSKYLPYKVAAISYYRRRQLCFKMIFLVHFPPKSGPV